MTIDKSAKILMTIFTCALLLNGLNPWINPTEADAVESAVNSGNDSDCLASKKIATQSLEAVNNTKRLLGYIESSVNEVKSTVNAIDRKMNKMSSFNSRNER